MRQGATIPRSSGWMVSPSWDLAFIIASPVAIVPLLWTLAHTALTPERLAIPVFAFATLGHHLPGYMRAYGDRALFRRFRLRFVVVPPALFVGVLLLVDPSLFGFAFAAPSSLQLLLVVWGAWHGLMQIYGFMRIYDAKQGIGHGLTQRLDLAICFAIFIGGFLYSDARTWALLNLAWQVGIPTFSLEALSTTRWVAGIVISALCIAYVTNMLVERQRGRRMGAIKLALAAATGGVYTYSGLVTTNILLGAAIFEVFHAIQYLAIVWYFNRRLESRVGEDFGLLRFLFRDRWSSLGLYLALTAAFGAIFLATGPPGYGPLVASEVGTDTLYLLFSAFFVTSSILHYYYDGFIWKLHDRDTGQNLGAIGPSLRDVSVPALMHFARWSMLVFVAAALAGLELSQPHTATAQDARMRALAALTPNVPEARTGLLMAALGEGSTTEALAIAEQNASARPRSHYAQAHLGAVHVARSDWPAAELAYRRALELRPQEVVYLTDLARTLAHQGPERHNEAAQTYRAVLEQLEIDAVIQAELGELEARRGNDQEAARLFESALARDPSRQDLRARLVASLLEARETKRAVELARKGVELDAELASAHQLLGTTEVELGRPHQAWGPLARAQQLDPELPGIDVQLGEALLLAGHRIRAEQTLLRASKLEEPLARVYFLLATLYQDSGRLEMAEVAKNLFVAAAPSPVAGYRTLGGLLAKQNDLAGAEAAYRSALRLEPAHPSTQARLDNVLRQRYR